MASERQYNLLKAAEDWKPINDSTVTSNALQIVLTPQAGQRIQIGNICLSGTTGGGGAEDVSVVSNSVTLWSEGFTVGTPLARAFGQPLPGYEGQSVTITASATALTAGSLTVSYRELPA